MAWWIPLAMMAGSMIAGQMNKKDGKNNNPADPAMNYMDQIEGKVSPYYDPYIKKGRAALDTLDEEHRNQVNNPTGMMTEIGNQFQASPGYQYNVDQMTQAANRAAAAGGMLGSPAEQLELSKNIGGLANQDYYNFLNTGLGQYSQGLEGLTGINKMGYDASSSMADIIASTMLNQAQLAYAGQANYNQAQGGQDGAMMGGMMSMMGNKDFMSMFNKGGGAAGAGAAGSSMGGWF